MPDVCLSSRPSSAGFEPSGHDRGAERGQDDPAKCRPAPGPERLRRLFFLAVELGQDRLHAPNDERKRHEKESQENAGGGEDDLHAVILEPAAHHRARAVQGDEHDPGHECGNRERQVDDGRDDLTAGEADAHEDVREQRPEHTVDDRREERHYDGQLDRVPGAEVVQRVLEVGQPIAVAALQDDHDRQEHEQAQVEEGRAAKGPAGGGARISPSAP